MSENILSKVRGANFKFKGEEKPHFYHVIIYIM